MQRNIPARLAVAVLLLLTFNSAVKGQSGTGAISGIVQDSSKSVLPGATITLISPGTVGGNQAAVADERGAYQFIRLVPGTYSVRGELQGFGTVLHERIVVNADVTARVDFTLDIGEIAETITVTSQSPLVDTTQALNQTALDSATVAVLPSRNDIWAIGRAVPSVILNKYEVGGTEAYQNSRAWVHGAGRNEGMLSVDGMNISCFGAAGASPCTFVDPLSYEEINYQTGNAPASSVAGGVSYNMVTRTGANTFRGGFNLNGLNQDMQWSNITPELRRDLLSSVPARVLELNPDLDPSAQVLKMFNFTGYASGPILRDKLWWAGTVDYGQLDQLILGSYNARGEQTIDDNERRSFSGKVSWQMAPGHQLHGYATRVQKMQFHASENRPTQFFEEATLVRNAPNTKYLEQARWTGALSPRFLLEVGASHLHGVQSSLNQPEVQPGDIPRFDRVTLINAVARATYSDNPGYRNFVNANLSYVLGSHDLRFGWQVDDSMNNSRTFSTSHFPAGLVAIYRNGVPDSVNTYTTPADFKTYHRTQAVYAQDRWTPFRNLTVNYGIRIQTATGGAPAGCTEETVFIASQCFDEIKGEPDFLAAAPRLAVVYDIFGDGRTALKVGVNRYIVGTGSPYTARINPRRVTNDTRSWTDRNGDLIPQLDELGPSSGYNFGISNRYADDISQPYSNEYSISLERELLGGIAVSIGYVYHGVREMIGSKNVAVPMDTYRPITVTERQSGQTVTIYDQDPALRGRIDMLWDNYPGLDEHYDGLEVTFRKRLANRWMFFGGVNYGRNITDINSEDVYNTADLNDPNYLFRRGRSALDVPLQVKVSGLYELPFAISMSGSMQYFTGFPERDYVTVGSDTVALTRVTQQVMVAPAATNRLPSVALTDLSFRRPFKAGTFTLEPVMDLYNIGNASTTTSRATQLGPTYHTVLGILRGRMLKVGLNMRF